jgi:deoxyribose-phosphate aldolase
VTSAKRERVARAVDHTMLKPGATEEDVVRAVAEAAELRTWGVCVFPGALPVAAPPGLAVVTVCGFPTGLATPAEKAQEALRAVEAGAVEVDMVVDPVAAFSGDGAALEGEVATVRRALDSAARGIVLKAILETAALGEDRIVLAALAAEAGGADFAKTSTGTHLAGGATVAAVSLLARTLDGRIGIKASGGIRDATTALAMLDAGATRLGTSSTRAILDGLAG